VHDIRCSRYGNANEEKNVQMDKCLSFSRDVCVMHRIGFYAARERNRKVMREFYAGNLVHGLQININESY